MKKLEILETEDIQGLVVRGYGTLKAARFLLLEIEDLALARRYLQGICADVNTAKVSPETFARQVAFTAPGLKRLGVPNGALDSFAREFLEGMDDSVRSEALGDRGKNDPSTWEWGRTPEDKVHVLVMLYAVDDTTLTPYVDTELKALAGAFRVVQKATITNADNKEHFGWKDGISMPIVEGVPPDRPPKKTQESWTGAIRPGEFVLGYLNEYDCYSERPMAEAADDPAGHLPVTKDGKRDLGRNGTYLIYREMTQDVPGYWKYLADNSREPGDDPVASAIALGAKMVGRWPSGAPLIMAPTQDEPQRATENKFTYGKDLAGLSCPLGAHIRRANPRDVLAADRGLSDSRVMVRKHQMVRRGRAFGRPVSEKMDPREILAAPADSEKRGLHFICLVGHISRQFEFVQRAWIHSANFAALSKDGDPIAAARRAHDDENANDEFTCPAKPLRRKYKQMPPFTRLVGGAYFFLPGIRALRFIAGHP